MTALSVNLNKVALIRNTRSNGIPSVLHAAQIALEAGADGITVHPRPDGRHVRAPDVAELAALMRHWPAAEFNVEGNPSHGLLDYVQQVRPQQCTFVPDESGAFTSDHGWNLPAQIEELRPMIEQAKSLGVRVSLFMDPLPEAMEHVATAGADRVELYTEPYAQAFGTSEQARRAGALHGGCRSGAARRCRHQCRPRSESRQSGCVSERGPRRVGSVDRPRTDCRRDRIRPRAHGAPLSGRDSKGSSGTSPSMIFGVGIDIIEIDRIAASYARFGERFARRILGAREFERFQIRRARSEKRGLAFLSTRFAGKEAVAKALGLGMRSPMRWHAVEILNDASGRPLASVHADLRRFVERHRLRLHVSLTDEQTTAAAYAIAEIIE